VTVVTRRTPHGIQVLSNRSEAKICDVHVSDVVHKDVWLAECQYSGETIFGITTYTLEVPVDDIAGVEVVEAPSDIG
jgi:hypothetical protein